MKIYKNNYEFKKKKNIKIISIFHAVCSLFCRFSPLDLAQIPEKSIRCSVQRDTKMLNGRRFSIHWLIYVSHCHVFSTWKMIHERSKEGTENNKGNPPSGIKGSLN